MNYLRDLESNEPEKVDDIKRKLKDVFNSTKDAWVLNGLYDYVLASNFSSRAIEVLVVVKEPHDKHYLDRSLEGIRGTNRLPHLTLLGHVVRKKPLWLYKIFHHHLSRELLRILKVETDIVIVVSALLILNILIPCVPGLVGPHLLEIFHVFSKLAAMNANSNLYKEVELVHLQISLYTLFHRLYGMFPCNFLSFLRKEYSTADTFPVFSHTVKPMLDTVRVNPLLITADEEWEKMPNRWKNVESHDIIVSCARLLINGGSSNRDCQQTTQEQKSQFNCKDLLEALRVTDKHTVSAYCKQLSKSSAEASWWSPSARFMEEARHIESTPTMIPLTPIARGFEVSSPYSEHEGSSPPEAAVEATPETTPIRDNIVAPVPLLMTANRSALSFTKDNILYGSKVPINDRCSFPTSPIKKESPPFRYSAPEIVPITQPSSKVSVMLRDRNQATNEGNVVELKPVRVSSARNVNDLIGNHERTHSVISSVNASTFVDGISNGNGRPEGDDLNVETVDDFDPCEPVQSGSPCSSGGLHMPDSKSLCNFALQMKRIRNRHYSQCNSDSEHFSPNNSPRDLVDYFESSKVRRANSCPEIKKSSPNSTASSDSAGKENILLEEKDENCVESFDDERITFSHPSPGRFGIKVNTGTQTDQVGPPPAPHFPYEHLFLDVFPPLTCEQSVPAGEQVSPPESENSLEERSPSIYERAYSPSKLLQKYIDAAVQCHNDKAMSRECLKMNTIMAENKYLIDMLRLMGVQLQLEEHKREIHAERNRRQLGRSRRNKTLEEHNNALIDQVAMLQKEIEHCNEEVMKIVKEKEAIIAREQKAAKYWKGEFISKEKEHKDIANQKQKLEAQLKEAKDLNEHNKKLLNEKEAILSDITNELNSFRKEVMEAKVLRSTVIELQAEVLKAGELIISYKNRLEEAHPPFDYQAQFHIFADAYLKEIQQLNHVINAQKLSLEASKSLTASLRKEIEEKENYSEKLNKNSKTAVETLKNEIKNLKTEVEKLKELYEHQLQRANDLDSKLSHAKRVTKLSNAVLAPRIMDYTSKLSAVFNADDSGSKYAQGGPKSPKRLIGHSDRQQMDLYMKTCSEPERLKMTAAAAEPAKDSQSTNTKAGPSVKSSVSGEAASSTSPKEPDTESSDLFKSSVKKKTRMECAEQGQLRPISFAYVDPESGKNND